MILPTNNQSNYVNTYEFDDIEEYDYLDYEDDCMYDQEMY